MSSTPEYSKMEVRKSKVLLMRGNLQIFSRNARAHFNDNEVEKRGKGYFNSRCY
jgi:hypothetical protein